MFANVILGMSLVLSARAFPCSWMAPNGKTYDFAALTKPVGQPEYRSQDATSVFVTNVCETSHFNNECAADEGLLCQYDLKTGNFVAVVARDSTPKWEMIEASNPTAGVKMTLSNGDLCQRNRPAEGTTFIAPRDTVFLFRCAEASPGMLFSIVDEFTACVTIVTFHTHLACAQPPAVAGVPPTGPTPATPTNPLRPAGAPPAAVPEGPEEELERTGIGGGWLFILSFFAVCLCYIGTGCAYNSQKFNTQGLDNCPHLDFWIQFPALVLAGFNYSVNKVKRVFAGDQEYTPLPQ